MTHLLFLQRDHATVHKRRPLFTGAGHHRRHRAHRHHLHGHHHLLLLCLRCRHGLRHREHWRSAHHHLDPRPGRHLLPRPLDLRAPHDRLRRLRPPHLGHHDPRDHPCLPPHRCRPHHLFVPHPPLLPSPPPRPTPLHLPH